MADFSDLYSAHSTWFDYASMNRIYKQYFLDYTDSNIAARKMSFSSYPGAIVSIDDFYIMDSGLTMLETTNAVYNNSLFDLITPNSLLAWQRVSLANKMARDGKQWTDIVAQYNSGTYNNQYMIINYNLFTPGKPLVPGLLWVVEQIPGYVEAADVTDQLERGYWPSYNVAYFPTIYVMSGYPAMVDKYGPELSYQLCPRAKIFRRDHNDIVDIDSFKSFMRSNNYQKDPFAKGDPWKAICSRGDLAGYHAGCTDSKLTTYTLQSTVTAWAISGPTVSNGIPPFSWDKFNSTIHEGQPQVFDFEYVMMDPVWK